MRAPSSSKLSLVLLLAVTIAAPISPEDRVQQTRGSVTAQENAAEMTKDRPLAARQTDVGPDDVAQSKFRGSDAPKAGGGLGTQGHVNSVPFWFALGMR